MRRLGSFALAALLALAPPSCGAGGAPSEPADVADRGPLEVEPLTPERLEAVLAPGSCDGPTAVFFGSGVATDEQEASALTEFAAAAADLSGLACFKALSCGRWPDACADRNLRRLPAVVLFPREGGAARPLAGRIDQRLLAGEVAKLAGSADRTTKVAGDATVAWLQDALRPVKVVLVSAKSTTPTILRALSGDRRLWPHVDFGFAQEGDKALVRYFQASEVPFIVAQCGEDTEVRQVYQSSDLTYGALRQWLLGLIYGDGAPFRKCLDDFSLSAMAEVVEESPTAEEIHVPYERLEYGVNGCPPGSEIRSVQECEAAIQMLGFDVDPRWVSTFPGLPRGCSIREEAGNSGSEHMHFNSAPSGQGREDLAPVCKVPVADAAPAAPAVAPEAPGAGAAAPLRAPPRAAPGPKVAASAPKAAAVAPRERERGLLELSAATQEELLGSEGLCLVYLRRGAITAPEVEMLLHVQERFAAQLTEQGTKLRFMWLDMQVERKVGRAFNPPALPSALVLNPHKRPRFALARHEIGQDGEPLPVRREAIEQLLGQVLGGDARFTAVAVQRLAAWAERVGAGGEDTGRRRRTVAAEAGAQGQGAPGRTSLYEKMDYGASGCTPETEIQSVQECEQALKSLGINAEPKWVSNYPGLPRGCSVREAVDAEQRERMHFNSADAGQGRQDLAPICRAPAPSATGLPQPLLPELSGRTHKALFGSDGLSLIFLREGPITREETRMLLALEKRFQLPLRQQGLRMTWMWLDVRVERKLAGAFDPEVLPSAVVLAPHGKPRFALLGHEEREGEALPADEASIVLLLNTVISGDAEFKPLPAQKLAAWADGTTA